MNKITYASVSLDCYMQQATAIKNKRCHKGVLSQDTKGRLRFEESVDPSRQSRHWTRNPRIFEGSCINLVRRKDGTVKFSFRSIDVSDPAFTPDGYALQVFNELSQALKNLE